MKGVTICTFLILTVPELFASPYLYFSHGYDFYRENAANRIELGVRYAFSIQPTITIEPGIQFLYVSGSSPSQALYRVGITGNVFASFLVGSLIPFTSLDVGFSSLNLFFATTNQLDSGLELNIKAGSLWEIKRQLSLGIYIGYSLFSGTSLLYNPIFGLAFHASLQFQSN